MRPNPALFPFCISDAPFRRSKCSILELRIRQANIKAVNPNRLILLIFACSGPTNSSTCSTDASFNTEIQHKKNRHNNTSSFVVGWNVCTTYPCISKALCRADFPRWDCILGEPKLKLGGIFLYYNTNQIRKMHFQYDHHAHTSICLSQMTCIPALPADHILRKLLYFLLLGPVNLGTIFVAFLCGSGSLESFKVVRNLLTIDIASATTVYA